MREIPHQHRVLSILSHLFTLPLSIACVSAFAADDQGLDIVVIARVLRLWPGWIGHGLDKGRGGWQ